MVITVLRINGEICQRQSTDELTDSQTFKYDYDLIIFNFLQSMAFSTNILVLFRKAPSVSITELLKKGQEHKPLYNDVL